MFGNRVSVRAFGIAQGMVLVLIVVSLIVFRRRQKNLAQNAATNFDSMNVHAAIRRANAARTMSRVEPAPPKSAAEAKPEEKAAPQLESALPSWSTEALPHEILGIAANSPPVAVEAAFKKLLKKYHPDRFAAAGKGYQKRAHHVVLLIQAARDKMIGKK
ncbi:MAG: J domain-containing protein [Deltaproteobacteria bacterium]|nr:J domain-containing protein [Deltaproteobacteria bacterium]